MRPALFSIHTYTCIYVYLYVCIGMFAMGMYTCVCMYINTHIKHTYVWINVCTYACM